MPAAPHESTKRGQLAALRRLVEEKFPSAPATPPARRWLTGCPALDQQGGLRRGALTEIYASAAGGQLALTSLLEMATREGVLTGLIDPVDSFAPTDWPPAYLHRLLWVRGGTVELSLKAADFLLRDGNLPLLILDLQLVPARQLQRIPAATWHRFHRVIEGSSTVLALLTPRPMVEGVLTRMILETQVSLDSLLAPRRDLAARMTGQVFERGQIVDFSLLEKSA